ncbi:MAG: hypothetical protein JWM47_1536 [Acidimicrobiales bacterium]|nr:hypothetical protein [Acidimicrobiales bacterium]
MSDDTRPGASTTSGHYTDPMPAWLELLCPLALRRELESRRTEGEALLAGALLWARAVSRSLSRFEDGLADQHLTDDLHRALGAALGVEELFSVADELGELTHIMASPTA